MNITKKHIKKKSRSSKLKEKYCISKKTHLAKEKFFILYHSLKISKQGGGGPNKLWGGQKKFEKLISVSLLPVY